MKNSKILAAVLVVLAASCARAEGGMMGNLTVTRDKISSIDINKNAADAGKVLDGFYSGAAAKKEKEASASVVYFEAPKRTLAQAEKEVCNAKAAKITKLASKVPALAPAAGGGAGGKKIDAQALLSQDKSWADDLHTVINDGPAYIKDNIQAKLDSQPTTGTSSIRG